MNPAFIGDGIESWYGIKILSVWEEINLPQCAKQTRQNKMKIIDTCKHAKDLLETIQIRARRAPELDDEKHAQLVQELYDKTREAYNVIFAAARIGY